MNLCHPKAPASLLTAGQGGNLNSQGADILLVPHIEVVSRQVDGRSVVPGDVNWIAALSAGGFGFVTAILLALTCLPEAEEK